LQNAGKRLRGYPVDRNKIPSFAPRQIHQNFPFSVRFDPLAHRAAKNLRDALRANLLIPEGRIIAQIIVWRFKNRSEAHATHRFL